MKVVAVLVLLAIGSQARSLEKRQGSTADRGILAALPIDITAQVANIQRQLSQITETFTRILPVGQLGKRSEGDNGAGTANGGGLPLIGNLVGMEQLQQQLSALQATLTGFLSQFTRVFSGFGGLLAEGTTTGGDQNQGGLGGGVPFLGQFTQQLQVLQQQLQSMMAQFTRALGGLQSDTSAPPPTQSQSGGEFPILGQLTNQLQALQQQLQAMMSQFTRALGGLQSGDTPSTALSLPDFSQFQRLINDLSLTLNQLLGSVTRIFGFGATGTGTGTH